MKFRVFGGLLLCLALSHVTKVEAETTVSEAQLGEIAAQLRALQKQLGEMQTTISGQAKRIATLESENSTLKGVGALATQTSAPSKSQPYLPEIGLIADMVATSSESREDEEGNDRLSVREVELVIGHEVDPYTRLDSTITFSDFEEPSLEEAYLTYAGLPGDFKLQLGRLRPKLGLASATHRDSLDTVDEPLVVQRYFGAEGLSRTGVEISNFLPMPWETVTHEVLLGAMEGGIGEGGTLLGETRRRPTFYARLKNFWEISDNSDLLIGGTYLRGSSDEDSGYEVNLYGADLKFTHAFNATQRFKLQAEAFFQDRSEPFFEGELAEGEDAPGFRENPWGTYALADLRFAERWSAGTRWDLVQSVNRDEEFRDADQALATYLTFHQSEFVRWRFQYEHVDFATGGNDEQFFLQATLAIGTHKHQIQ